ncbi:FAD-dependent oxidoreductase [Paenibacillus terreus]|uniref:FAD-dependent oxidoreductase n=1 Tax=Paenibacillus terreus TaxID=1387834 RepID=A0ABV5B9H1_9BACL
MNENKQTSTELPPYSDSIWHATTPLPEFSPLAEDVSVDVAVVGAGISGLTTAFLLAKEGLRVTVLEARKILDGTTGNTTAKITAQHELIYDKLISTFGEEQARLYYEANEGALRFIRELVRDHGIDCQLTEEAAYVYGQSESSLQTLKKEFEAYEKLRIPGEWVERIPLPITTCGAIRLKGQAQFHPLSYLKFILNELVRMGVTIYEHTTVAEVEEGTPIRLSTHDKHTITCDHLVVATHFPFYDPGMYFARLHPSRSYAIAIKPETTYEGGMFISMDEPKRSFRSVMHNDEQLVIVGGGGHKTGQGGYTLSYYEQLEQYAGGLLGIRNIFFRWSAQDLITLDNVPYIGQITEDKENIWVATGFAKWGMTSGTLAGQMISSQILGRETPYKDVFTPSRFKGTTSFTTLVSENANVAKELITGKMSLGNKNIEELQNDEGAVVSHNGKRAGAYKDQDGQLHVVDTTCTHMGCELEWNAGERSWDCPCHGSRFNFDGKVIEGPAMKDLTPLNAEQ